MNDDQLKKLLSDKWRKKTPAEIKIMNDAWYARSRKAAEFNMEIEARQEDLRNIAPKGTKGYAAKMRLRRLSSLGKMGEAMQMLDLPAVRNKFMGPVRPKGVKTTKRRYS